MLYVAVLEGQICSFPAHQVTFLSCAAVVGSNAGKGDGAQGSLQKCQRKAGHSYLCACSVCSQKGLKNPPKSQGDRYNGNFCTEAARASLPWCSGKVQAVPSPARSLHLAAGTQDRQTAGQRSSVIPLPREDPLVFPVICGWWKARSGGLHPPGALSPAGMITARVFSLAA